ncbi:MAG: hypothetical protein P4M11_10780 [Candidatus Pacebacteria bacterium]|nr:hypothetical protein [Candidatus Paceibacterota bacterium]
MRPLAQIHVQRYTLSRGNGIDVFSLKRKNGAEIAISRENIVFESEKDKYQASSNNWTDITSGISFAIIMPDRALHLLDEDQSDRAPSQTLWNHQRAAIRSREHPHPEQ